ncbi:MAG: 50S ribosomal protein L13 [Bacteroidia bacterium]|nr:50S ribosomal protein L13 [Bacteroidia bacterium]MCX7651904.1 50S ribosomal protein L13 [Bacteroidia bacterium]MDW8416055.1 50S ribosomal protein L13 [Bacteroidia bacterium]
MVVPKGRVREWVLVDATGVPLGRLASAIARLLRGKHLTYFAPQWNLGAAVVVINADKVVLTGSKPAQKTYIRHTGYPGGQRHVPIYRLSAEAVIRHAVKGMLPKNRLQDRMLRNLFIYEGSTHPHAAQQPKPITLSL